MHLIEKHKIKWTNKYYNLFVKYSKYSNNLYNQALYQVRKSLEDYEQNGNPDDKRKGWLFYADLDKYCKSVSDNFDNYHLLPSATSQQILRQLDKDLKSYREKVKKWSKNPSAYTGKPNFPYYKKRGGKHQLLFTNQQCKNKEGILSFPKLFQGFTVKLYHPDAKIKQVRVNPKATFFEIEVVYEVETKSLPTNSSSLIAGIDLGLDNLATVTFSDFSQPIIINGKPLKSLNTYYNKLIKNYKSILDKTQKGQFSSRKLVNNYQKRENQIMNSLHQASSKLVNLLVERGTTEVVIGHNVNQKQGSKLKNFVQIPIFKMIGLLKYKLELHGIKVTETEESYTSGTSFIDGEQTIQADYLKSRRLQRGLFRTNRGQLINADVNGAYQIMKKIHPWIIYQGQTSIFNPIKL